MARSRLVLRGGGAWRRGLDTVRESASRCALRRSLGRVRSRGFFRRQIGDDVGAPGGTQRRASARSSRESQRVGGAVDVGRPAENTAGRRVSKKLGVDIWCRMA